MTVSYLNFCKNFHMSQMSKLPQGRGNIDTLCQCFPMLITSTLNKGKIIYYICKNETSKHNLIRLTLG